ncbi:hypothetical protein CMU19_04435 [Elizabethkingia anophelis]|nr:hypothetical protein [Elizabethkingia anophelis]
MSRSYPIWNDVTNCSYNSNKSYGSVETGRVDVLVGSSSKNSHEFVSHVVTKREIKYKGEYVIIFRFSVDGVLLKYMIFENKNGKAGDLIKTVSKLPRIKSLKLEP